jgi:hypothetical protein
LLIGHTSVDLVRARDTMRLTHLSTDGHRRFTMRPILTNNRTLIWRHAGRASTDPGHQSGYPSPSLEDQSGLKEAPWEMSTCRPAVAPEGMGR